MGRPSRIVTLNMTPRGKLSQRAWNRCSHETGGASVRLSLGVGLIEIYVESLLVTWCGTLVSE